MKKNIWYEFEGDNWFQRNKHEIHKKEKKEKQDVIFLLLKLYGIKPKKVISIGASNGYRLNSIHKLYLSKVVAVEPSIKAIEDGKKRYPHVKFIHSTCEDLKIKEKFDLLIINFVFSWVYREKLLSVVKNIDDLITSNGYLVIGDFGTENFTRKKYHHLKKKDFFTWKMPYWEIFTRTGNYLEIAKLRYNLEKKLGKLTNKVNTDKMGTTVLLKKQKNFISLLQTN